MQDFRDKFEALATDMNEKIEKCRGLSSALTKLEESAFWLNKGITRNDGETRHCSTVSDPIND